jgi:Nucleotide modification associated domain 2
MGKVYMYVVARDFGFAPNPFHGMCTLATCKPSIRSTAQIGDWVIGLGGRRLMATGKCIFAMQVSEVRTFDEYWAQPAYRDKLSIRNGSMKMMVGDNIYHHEPDRQEWRQSDSHHSYADGSTNRHNLERDTRIDRVLISRRFFYFGKNAPMIPCSILTAIGFRNAQGHRKFDYSDCCAFFTWLFANFGSSINQILGDPFDFEHSNLRYSVESNIVS